jgi:autotransporter-associated beta strand protein
MNLHPCINTPRATLRTASRQSSDRLVSPASIRLACALVALTGLAATAHAQATWVGDTSQDWNAAANWSSDPANPTGNFTINTATAGVFPVLTGASAFAPVDIIIGAGAGGVGRLDLVNATVGTGPNNTGNTNWLIMGTPGGTGTLNIDAGSTFRGKVHMARVNSGTGVATLNLNGTLISPGETVISDATNNVSASQGVMNIGPGATLTSESDIVVAFAGNSSAFGELNVAAGASITIASTVERWFIVNQWDSNRGTINFNGGTLTLNAGTDFRFSAGNGIGASVVHFNSGAITAANAGSVLDLNRGGGNVNNTFNLNGGTLTIGQVISFTASGTRVFNFNGGTLKALASEPLADTARPLFMPANAASTANVKAGGAIIDTNGFDITIAKALTADTVSTGGGLTKLGAGKLTLTGVNTYTGTTTVSEGTLALADNAAIQFAVGANGVNSKLTGPGTVILDGDIAFDLTNASTTVGNSWTVIDHASLTETYGSTFSVAGFSLNGTKWTKPAVGTTIYQFDPATGLLTTVVDPTITFPPPVVTAAPSKTTYPLGSEITLRVSATGTGNLTYQWYYQADSGATPTAISGANASSYTVTGATAAANGIYSVIVSDDANGSTPVTTTFPAYTVLPGAAFAVAHYRFEEGPALAAITTTNDSIGTNHLTALGTPNYANDALPYSIIPATGAANTLGVNFPATGNNGLIAPTSGTLAAEPFDDFTIEAFFRLDNLNGWQTVVGRDDSANPGQGVGAQALFYLSKAGAAVGTGLNNAFRIELIDRSGASLQVNSQTVPVVGNWYHVAAVGDSAKGTLTLYVNGVSVGSTTGFTGLFVPTADSDTPWTLGRGDYGFANVDYLRGDLDEVRFSRAALPTSQFLNSANGISVVNPSVALSPGSQTVGTGASVTLIANGTSNMGGTVTYQWYKDDVLLSGQTNATLTVDTAAASSSTYKVVVSDNTPGYVVSADVSVSVRVISLPAAGGRSIGLNFVGAGNGNWSDILGTLAPGYTAGFYPAANWNNSATVTGVTTQTTPLALTESTGTTGYATATWNSAGTWSGRIELGTPDQKSEHGRLLHGYIESRAATGSTVSLSNIPYGTYDVLVYVSGGTSTANVGSITLDSPGATTYYYRVLQNDTSRPAATPTAEAPYAPLPMIGDSTDAAAAATAAPATFVRFTGVTGSELTVTAKDAVLNANAGGIAAIQIVDTTPAGTAYPPTVVAAPASLLRVGGASATLSVSAVSNNAGGTLSYKWQKDSVDLPGKTGSTLTLTNLTSADTGRYSVVVTDTTSGSSATTSRSASVVVVDANRALLINGDLGTTTASTMPYSGVLLPDGSVSINNVGAQTNTWNNVTTAVGSGSGALSSESSGLSLSGLTLAYANVGGSADSLNETDGAIDITGNSASGAPILRDLAFTDSQTIPMTLTVGGLQALSGHRVKLVVYASGLSSKFTSITNLNDAATITLAPANNHLGQAPAATDNNQGRDLRYNPQAFVTFDGVVAADGTVGWNVGADSDGGQIPVNAFQLLVTSEEVSPPVPAGLVATVGNGQVALTWSASTGAASYTIARSTVSGGPYTTLSAGVVTTSSYTDATAVNGTTYYYVVASANALATSAYSAEVSATPVASGTALELWREAKFGSTANSGNGADTFDADFDGIPNLLEYALGSEPLSPNAGAPATVGRSGNFLTLGFHHIGDATLVYTIEATNDVGGAWTTVHTYPALSTVGDELYQDTVSLVTQPRRFLRLRVTTP